MAYVQLSLLNIPAIVVHGNALSVEGWATWLTPAHVLGGWGTKLRLKRFREAMEVLIDAPKGAAVEVRSPIPSSVDPGGECVLYVSADAEQPPAPMPVIRVIVPDDQLALF